MSRRLLPYLATAALVIEADRVIDVATLAWPVLVALAVCGAIVLADRKLAWSR